MEPTPAKPPKKRRRWLIVAFVLLLVSLVTWWFWPRGDARFVGKWTLIDRTEGEPVAVVWLRANATGWIVEGSQQMYFSWHASDTELKIGHEYTGSLGRAAMSVAEALLKLTGRTFPPAPMKLRVVNISAERIELVDDAASASLSLERIPE
jgi:hypothetical protein